MVNPTAPSTREDETRGSFRAMLFHLGGLFGLFAGPLNVLLPWVGWLASRKSHPFAAAQAREAVNFQISVLIYGLVAVLPQYVPGLPHFYLTVVLMLLVVLFDIVMVTRAVLAIRNGLEHRYPLTLRPF